MERKRGYSKAQVVARNKNFVIYRLKGMGAALKEIKYELNSYNLSLDISRTLLDIESFIRKVKTHE